jgi:hypothetical protein
VFLDSGNLDYVPGDQFIDFGFADLDLTLRSSGGTVIKASNGISSNVEHIFAQVPSAGTYTLEVETFDEQVPFALAWWAGPDERPATCPGDFDGDGDVDGRDFLEWQRDPSVGDIEDWQSGYGSSCLTASNTAVPEPSSLILASILMLSLTTIRKPLINANAR